MRVSRSVGQEGGFVAVCADISELKDQETKLKETNASFDIALTNMSQGLCMYDEQNRLMVVNRRFCEIFRLNENQLHHGMPLSGVTGQSVAAGSLTLQGANDLALLFDGAPAGAGPAASANFPAHLIELDDGRVVAVVQQRLQNGGRVATFEDVTESKRTQDRVVFLARHDALTGLPNRVLLTEIAERAIARMGRAEGFAVFCLDLDRFKEVNDAFGHPCGDDLLRQVAERLRSCVRSIDTVCRMGGDEFAIIQAMVRDRADAAMLAARIIERLDAPYQLQGRRVSTGVSIGIALAPEHGADFETLLKRSDAALYSVKKGGRGGWCLFDNEIDERLQKRRIMEIELRAALANGEFELHYQPICDLRTGKACVFEALLRWNHPVRGRVAPGEFIALCEEAGLIIPIGEWVLSTACLEARNWPDDVKVAVNVSAMQFIDSQFVQTVRNTLAASSLAPHRLELEITESVLMSTDQNTLEKLHEVRNFGVNICLDDFGTGYSSLSYLHKFPFDKIKIDQSFVRDLAKVGGSDVIMKTIINLCLGMGARMTAEGVETIEQLNWLIAAGCDEAQGYILSRPVAASSVNAVERSIRKSFPPSQSIANDPHGPRDGQTILTLPAVA